VSISSTDKCYRFAGLSLTGRVTGLAPGVPPEGPARSGVKRERVTRSTRTFIKKIFILLNGPRLRAQGPLPSALAETGGVGSQASPGSTMNV
jgi:hypothetical protein